MCTCMSEALRGVVRGTPRCRQRHSTVSSEAYGCEASDVHPVRNGPLMFRCVEPANGPEPRNSLEPLLRGTQIAIRAHQRPSARLTRVQAQCEHICPAQIGRLRRRCAVEVVEGSPLMAQIEYAAGHAWG